MRAAATLLLGVLLAPVSVEGVDRVSRPARGLRYVRRALHRGGLHATVHALYVDLCDPAVSLRATAPGEGGRTVSAWARRVGAIAAVNGDYFDMSRLAPLGPARGAGRWWPEGPREHRDALFVARADGAAEVLDAPAGDARALWDGVTRTLDPRWTEVVAVRERVLVGGVVRESPSIAGRDGRHPRTAIGLSADRRTLILAVVEGRSEAGSGATARELGEVMLSLGAWEGMKLDGGGSSAMFIGRRGVVNHPSDGAERAVATHLGVVVRRGVPQNAPSRCRAVSP